MAFFSKRFCLIILCYSSAFISRKHGKKVSNIYSALDNIFDGYKPYARPVKFSDTTTIINVSFNKISINDVDEKRQTMSQNLYLDLAWIDQHLTWNASHYAGLRRLVVPQAMVWLPDIIVSPLTGRMQRLGYDELPVIVESNGQITWRPSGMFTTQCEMDITNFPFDKQFCELKLELWSSSTRDALLRLSQSQPVGCKIFGTNSEWQLITVIPVQVNDTLSDDAVSSEVVLRYRLRRRPMFVTLTLVLPTILLALLSTLVFALPAESGEKMSLCVTVFLTFMLSMSIMLNVLPSSSLKVSMHVTYLAMLTTCSALSVLLSLYVLHLYHRREAVHRVGKRWEKFVLCVRRYKRSNLHDFLPVRYRPALKFDRDGSDNDDSCSHSQRIVGGSQAGTRDGPGSLPSYAAAMGREQLKVHLALAHRRSPENLSSGQPEKSPQISSWKVGLTRQSNARDHTPHNFKDLTAKNAGAYTIDGFDKRGKASTSQQAAQYDPAHAPDNAAVAEQCKTTTLNVANQPKPVKLTDQSEYLSSDRKIALGANGQAEKRLSVTDHDQKYFREKTNSMEMMKLIDLTEAAVHRKAPKHVKTKKRRDERRKEDKTLISWENVAECLDFVLFRCFLSFVVLATVIITIVMMVEFNDLRKDWERC